MNNQQTDKKIGPILMQPQDVVVRLTLFLLLAFCLLGSAATASAASKTWVPTTGGLWTTAANWNPSGAPAEGDDVTIPADQSANITAVPAITLSNLTINGTCIFAAATSGTALTASNSFTVISGKTLTLGAPSARLNFTLASTATGTIAGTVVVTSGGGTFLCNGDLTMTSTGIINGPGIFTLSAGATLRIGSTAGISSSGSSGNIQVSGGLNYNVAANYVYDGTANQTTGTGLPSNLTGSLTINNPGNTVTLNNAETIASGGTVNIVSGTFATGTSLTMATTSSINRSGGTVTGTLQGSGVYNVTYTGNSMTTSSELSGAGLNNVTVNLSAGQTLTLGANVSPDGNLTVNSGALDLSTFTINRSSSGGIFTLANGATLLVGGASNFPANYSAVNLGDTSTVNYDAAGAQNVSAQTYGNLIFSGSGTKSIVSGTSITGNLNIGSGAIASIGSGLVIPVGSLTLGGLGEASGTWGSTTATLATFHNDTYFAATTGYLNVSSDTRTTPTVTAWPTANSIVYGQTLASAALSGGSASVPGTFAFTTPSTAPNAGTAPQSVTFTPTDLSTYTTTNFSVSVTVAKANPTVTAWPTANSITYGQTLASATLSGGSATPAGSFAFTTPSTAPNAGTAPQSVTYTPIDIANYNTASSTVSVTVAKANPNVTAWPTASAITYGQTLASSTLTGGSATPAGSFAFTTPTTAPNAGTAAQSVTYLPTDTANYNTASSTVSVTVNKADPNVTAWPSATAITYGQTLASSTLSGGSATPAGSFAFTTPTTAPNAGTAAQSVTYTPTDTANYNTASSTVSVTVNPKALTVTGITADNKPYDGNTTATLNTAGAALVGKVGTDDVTLNTAGATGAFADSNVGNGKSVQVSGLTLGGADMGNYTLTQPSVSANITQAGLTVAGIEAENKVYDGTDTATLILSNAVLVGVVSGDTVTLDTNNAAGVFADKNVGTSKVVTISGLALLGADAAKYTLTQPATNADITQASLTVTGITASDKPYDGNTTATLDTTSAALNGVFSGDDVTLNTASAAGAFSDANAGSAKAVQVSGLSISGGDAPNYALTQPTLSANITPADPVVTEWPTATPIIYGQTLASSTLSGGSATPAGSFAFTTPSTTPGAGTATQSVTYTPTDTANYNTASSTVLVTVNPKALTVTGITANDKVYDGNTTATLNTVSAALVGKVGADDVTLNTASASGDFSDANVGTGKTVQVSGLTLGGTDMGNYALTQPTLTASITSPSPGNIDDGLSVWIVLDTGSHYLEMSFRRNKNAAAMGLQYSPQVSGDKQTWFSDNSHVSELSVVPFDSQFDLVTVRALSPITTLAPRFARLIVVATVPSPVQTTSQVWIGTDTAIQGNGGSGTKFTTFSQRMIRPIAAAGTVSSLQNSILTDTNATWTDGQFGTNGIRSYVEFDSGLSADIANSSGGSHTLTLAGSPGGIVSIGDPYRIRSHFTIASLFGTNNETGLKTAQNPAQADNILLQIPETQQTLTIFYFSNSAAQLWLRADFSAASNQIIYPEQGVLVRRIAPGNLDLFASGPVKSGSAIVPVEQGFNLLGTLQSINSLSISALGLYTGSPLTGIASGLNPTAADNLLVVQPDGSTATYFYFKDTHGNESWLDPSFNSANAVPINPGSAFFIHRKPANPAFNWSMPAQ